MYWDIEVTSEDENEMIGKIAQKIHEYELIVPAILVFASIKPIAFIGSQMGRFFISPFLPAFGKNIDLSGEKFLQIFEKHENIEKLIKAVEELSREEEERKKAEKKERTRLEAEKGENHKKWWHRFLPFLK